MTIECYTTTCRHHSFHSGADDGPYCYREECREAPLLLGELRSSRHPNAISPWRVWTGVRWQHCWTALGAALLAQDLRRKPSTAGRGLIAVTQTSVYGPVFNILPMGAVINVGALI